MNKRFENTIALKEVSLRIEKGSVHGLVGENGAGKSTLTGILAGAIAPDSGRITIEGGLYQPRSISDAIKAGVAQVFQEINLVPSLSVLENLFMGDLAPFTRFGLVHWKKAKNRAREVLSRVKLDLDPARPVGELDIGVKKMIELARLLYLNPRIVILDELTACLTEPQTSLLFDLIRGLTGEGRAVIFVSHRMEEIRNICQVATVLRDGVIVTSVEPGALTELALASLTVGRNLGADVRRCQVERQKRQLGPIRAEFNDLSHNHKFRGVCFSVREGEIVGFAGLENSGAEQLLESIYGISPPEQGKIRLEGRDYKPRNPQKAIAEGITFVPRERELAGIINVLSVESNILLSRLQQKACFSLLRRSDSRTLAS